MDSFGVPVSLPSPVEPQPSDSDRSRGFHRRGCESRQRLARHRWRADFDEWIRSDLGLVHVSDCVLRISGYSVGGDMEADYAVRHDIPLFTDLSDLYATMANEIED